MEQEVIKTSEVESPLSHMMVLSPLVLAFSRLAKLLQTPDTRHTTVRTRWLSTSIAATGFNKQQKKGS